MDERPHYEDLMHRQFLQLDELYGAFAKSRGESYLSMWTLCELVGHPEGLNHKQMAETLHLPKQTVSSIVASPRRGGRATRPCRGSWRPSSPRARAASAPGSSTAPARCSRATRTPCRRSFRSSCA